MSNPNLLFDDGQIRASIQVVIDYLRAAQPDPEAMRSYRQPVEPSKLLVARLLEGLADQVEFDREWLAIGGDGGPPPSFSTWEVTYRG